MAGAGSGKKKPTRRRPSSIDVAKERFLRNDSADDAEDGVPPDEEPESEGPERGSAATPRPSVKGKYTRKPNKVPVAGEDAPDDADVDVEEAPGEAPGEASGEMPGEASGEAQAQDAQPKRRSISTGKKAGKGEAGGRPLREDAPKKRRHWPLVAVVSLLVLCAVCALLFCWQKWWRFDDAADIQGEWQVVATGDTIVLDGHKLKLTTSVSYDYRLDVQDKTIEYSFGDLVGGGHYYLDASRRTLVIIDGDDELGLLAEVGFLPGDVLDADTADDEVTVLQKVSDNTSAQPSGQGGGLAGGTTTRGEREFMASPEPEPSSSSSSTRKRGSSSADDDEDDSASSKRSHDAEDADMDEDDELDADSGEYDDEDGYDDEEGADEYSDDEDSDGYGEDDGYYDDEYGEDDGYSDDDDDAYLDGDAYDDLDGDGYPDDYDAGYDGYGDAGYEGEGWDEGPAYGEYE